MNEQEPDVFRRKKRELFAAVASGDLQMLSALIDSGDAPSLARGVWDEDDEAQDPGRCPEGWTAVMLAANQGKADAVRLLAPASDLSMGGSMDTTALMWAAHSGCADCARALLPGSDLGAKNGDGETALGFASRFGHADFVQAIISDARWRDIGREQVEDAFGSAYGYGNWEVALLLAPFQSEASLLFWGSSDSDGLIGMEAAGLEALSDFWPIDLARKRVSEADKALLPRLAQRVLAWEEAQALNAIVSGARESKADEGDALTATPGQKRKTSTRL